MILSGPAREEQESMRRWYESEESNRGIIVGGQVYFVRNVEGYPFEDKMSEAQQQELAETVCDALREAQDGLPVRFRYFNLTEMKGYEQQAMIGRLAVPPLMYVKGHQMGLLLSEDESVSILINGKEHICIQVSCAGAHIQEAVRIANDVDDRLNQHSRYAFSRKYGYLTASPLYTGTGMSASYLLHLPYLEKKQLIGQLEKGLGQYGFSLRAQFHGQTGAPGSIYRVRNRKTLGLSESEIISALEHLTGQTVEQERKVAEQVLKGSRLQEEDQMYRAYGLLKYARDLNYDETMEYLSIARTGDLNGVWHSDRPVGSFAMMVDVQDAVLSSEAAFQISGSQQGCARAEYIQRHLTEIGQE